MKKIKLISLFLVFLFAVVNFSYAQDLTLIFSGQTHAMLYPCSCPFEQDGGIARRSTLVKDLRKSDPGLLLLDCGSFTAGGKMDEYTKDKVLDSKRTEVNLLALQLMGYDALGITPDEFNLGEEFFSKNITLKRPAYLSANLASDKVLPYLVKETNGVKVGIIGLTNLGLGKKLVNLKVNPVQGIAELITKIKKQGAQVIIVISSLGEDEDLKLVAQVKGIDLLFVGYNPQKNEAQTKIGTTFFFRPFWQGRKLGKLTLQLKDKKLFSCQLEELRVSNKLADDPEILKILPRCYSDSNCKQKGLIGSCQNPGELRASCLFTELNKVSLLVITTRDCRVCHPEEVVGLLKQQFPGLTPEYVYLPDPLAVKLIKDFSLSSLPAYILGKEVEKDRNFDNFKNNLELKQDLYLVRPQVSGIAYLVDRQVRPGNLDLFFSLFEPHISQLLELIREFNPRLHFLALEENGVFEAKNGVPEVDEYLRGVCVAKYVPLKFLDYLVCRAKDLTSPLWGKCLAGVDLEKVETCAQGAEGKALFKENIALNKELKIMFGPTYLMDNQQLFSTSVTPNVEELRKIIKKR